MKRVMTKILNLPGVIVEDSKETKETLILSVRVQKKTAACPRCGEIKSLELSETRAALHSRHLSLKTSASGDDDYFLGWVTVRLLRVFLSLPVFDSVATRLAYLT
jgi:hypothetical protein